jgi:hypothetical protein
MTKLIRSKLPCKCVTIWRTLQQAYFLISTFHYQSIKPRTHIPITRFHIRFSHTRTQFDVVLSRRFGADVVFAWIADLQEAIGVGGGGETWLLPRFWASCCFGGTRSEFEMSQTLPPQRGVSWNGLIECHPIWNLSECLLVLPEHFARLLADQIQRYTCLQSLDLDVAGAKQNHSVFF